MPHIKPQIEKIKTTEQIDAIFSQIRSQNKQIKKELLNANRLLIGMCITIILLCITFIVFIQTQKKWDVREVDKKYSEWAIGKMENGEYYFGDDNKMEFSNRLKLWN